MLFYYNLCLSSVANATLAIFLLNCFYSIINNTSTYNTDYILIEKENYQKAIKTLSNAGYKIIE